MVERPRRPRDAGRRGCRVRAPVDRPRRGRGATDRELLARFLDHRDATAFEALVRRHHRLVRSAVTRVLADPNDADATGKQLRSYDGHRGSVGYLQFTADGKRLVSANGGTVWVWDAAVR